MRMPLQLWIFFAFLSICQTRLQTRRRGLLLTRQGREHEHLSRGRLKLKKIITIIIIIIIIRSHFGSSLLGSKGGLEPAASFQHPFR